MAKKILVIEDEIQVSDYLESIFQDSGYETVAAPNVEEALKLLRSEKPDLITLDLQLPEAHGAKFYQQFRKEDNSRHIPLVVITGQTAPHRSIKPDKAAAIVSKPFEPEYLVDIVKRAMGDS
jgi:CheY-like chemotaxis protein